MRRHLNIARLFIQPIYFGLSYRKQCVLTWCEADILYKANKKKPLNLSEAKWGRKRMAATEVTVSATDTAEAEEGKTLWKDVIVALLLFVLTFVTVSGNVIVLLAFVIEKKLRNTFTYFIANLAVTDFFVGFVAMLFYTFDTVFGFWPFGTFMCGVWIFFDYAMTFASVFTLVAISIDR